MTMTPLNFARHTSLRRAMPGALVISLDFELHWGVFDRVALDGAEKARLLAARTVVSRLLELFKEFSVHATWAVVGTLFATSREDLSRFCLQRGSGYLGRRLDFDLLGLGASEDEDPFHFAPSLIEEIAKTGGQEIGSHSFSHLCSLDPGQSADDFEADLRSAVAIASRFGHSLESYVFPRNEINPEYLPLLARHGFKAYRGTEGSVIKRSARFERQRQLHKRAGRLIDSYIDLCGDEAADWPCGEVPASIPASRYLRPYSPRLRSLRPLLLGRIRKQMKVACEQGRIFHLWCHPEDFALHPEENLLSFRQILAAYAELKAEHGMLSLSMHETLEFVAARSPGLSLAAS